MHQLTGILKTASGITCHSEEVRSGTVFVAIRGRIHDGNQFISSAVRKGAAAIVTDVETSGNPGVPVYVVPDAREACAWLAAEFYRHPSKELSLAGVTGTNGKTTIAAMLEQIYRSANFKAGMIGTVNIRIGDAVLPSKLTTPDSISLQHYLRQMRDNQITHAAMEVSAQGMELHRVDQVAFSCGILTNICPDHLDFHGNFDRYIAAKHLFPSYLSGAPLIVNAADCKCGEIARKYDGPVITAGVNTDADISAQVLRSNACGSLFQLTMRQKIEGLPLDQQKPYRLRVPVPGIHNVENALFAAIAALWQGVSLPAIAAALSKFGGVERRFKVFDCSGCTVIDDTALNPGSIDAVFHTVNQFRYKRLIVVNAIRGCRGPAINAANAQALIRWQRAMPFTMIITASDDQTAFTDAVSHLEKLTFLSELDRSQANYLYTETLAEAILAAQAVAQPGDMLLLIGAQGMDQGYSLLAAAAKPPFMAAASAFPQ